MLSIIATVSATKVLMHHGCIDWQWVRTLVKNQTIILGAKGYLDIAPPGDIPIFPVVLASRPLEPRADMPYATAIDLDPGVFLSVAAADPENDVLVLGGERTILKALPYASVVHVEVIFGELPALGRRLISEEGWGPWTIEDCQRCVAGKATYSMRYELRRKA